jgi:hypothetical protein
MVKITNKALPDLKLWLVLMMMIRRAWKLSCCLERRDWREERTSRRLVLSS